MSSWSKVGNWLKTNGTGILKIAGAVATGNVPLGIAAVASMVSEATGETDPEKALAGLQSNPELLVKLKEIASKNERSIRTHHRAVLQLELEDNQKEHEVQQATIQNGDNATDIVVRRTRPGIARQSWYSTAAYVFLFEFMRAMGWSEAGANMQLAALLVAPCGAYMGFRTIDKIAPGVGHKVKSMTGKLLGR